MKSEVQRPSERCYLRLAEVCLIGGILDSFTEEGMLTYASEKSRVLSGSQREDRFTLSDLSTPCTLSLPGITCLTLFPAKFSVICGQKGFLVHLSCCIQCPQHRGKKEEGKGKKREFQAGGRAHAKSQTWETIRF